MPRFHAAHGLHTTFRPEPESSPAQRIAPAAARPGVSQDVSIRGLLQIVSSPSTRSVVGTLVVGGGPFGFVTPAARSQLQQRSYTVRFFSGSAS